MRPTFLQFLYEATPEFNSGQPAYNQSQPGIYNDVDTGKTNNNVDPKDNNPYNKKASQDFNLPNDDGSQSDVDNDQDIDKNNDPNKQGLIRRIKNAHLIYKRKVDDGTYEELWIYNIEKGVKDELDVRNAILSGTDVNPKTGISQSGKQKYVLWTMNNVQMLQVLGLPN